MKYNKNTYNTVLNILIYGYIQNITSKPNQGHERST